MKGKIISLILIVLFLIGFGFYGFVVDYQYERAIGSHMDNARDMNTPSRMIKELESAKTAMEKVGLESSDYGALIFKKPSNSMRFQYEHLDGIIERVRAVEEWRLTTYGEGSVTTESLGDVYESKMDNLRDFINEEGRSDWIAKDAWYIKHHVILYLFDTCIFIVGALAFFGLILWMSVEARIY